MMEDVWEGQKFTYFWGLESVYPADNSTTQDWKKEINANFVPDQSKVHFSETFQSVAIESERNRVCLFLFSLIHLTDVRGASRLATAGAAAWLVHSSSLTPYGLDGPTWGEIFFSSSENALVCQREREGSRALIPPFSMPKPKSVNIFRWCHHLTNYQMIFP